MCVLGMGRSGTSLTARVLNLLGVDLGPELGLVSASPQNEQGYWERRAIFDLNEAILTAMGGDYANPPQLEPGWEQSPTLAVLKRRARDLLEECFGGSRLWGFKDPRTSLTLPFWRDIIPHMRYVICVRNPAEVAASFLRYPNEKHFHDKDWSGLWLRSTASALLQTADSPRMLVFYEDYFDELHLQVEGLAAFVDQPVTRSSFSAIEKLVDSNLRHHSVDPESPAADEPGGHGAQRLYAALRALPRTPTDKQLRRVDGLARRLSTAYTRGALPSPRIAPPAELARFPDDLVAPGVVSMGIYKDGWLERESQILLAADGAAQLIVRAQVLPGMDQRLDVLVDGRAIASKDIEAGPLTLILPLPLANGSRSIELRWAGVVPLASPDNRRAAALLEFVGLQPLHPD